MAGNLSMLAFWSRQLAFSQMFKHFVIHLQSARVGGQDDYLVIQKSLILFLGFDPAMLTRALDVQPSPQMPHYQPQLQPCP